MTRRKDPRFITLMAVVSSPPRYVKLLETQKRDPHEALAAFESIEEGTRDPAADVLLMVELESEDGTVLGDKVVSRQTAHEMIGTWLDLDAIIATGLRNEFLRSGQARAA